MRCRSSTAGRPACRRAQFAEWVVGPTKRIVDKVRQAKPAAKIIGFPRAATLEGYEYYVRETGVDAVSLDTAAPMGWAVQELGGRVTLQGNLDPIVLIAGGEALSSGGRGDLDGDGRRAVHLQSGARHFAGDAA